MRGPTRGQRTKNHTTQSRTTSKTTSTRSIESGMTQPLLSSEKCSLTRDYSNTIDQSCQRGPWRVASTGMREKQRDQERRISGRGAPALRANVAELRALAHPLRLRILELFAEAPRTTMQVAE